MFEISLEWRDKCFCYFPQIMLWNRTKHFRWILLPEERLISQRVFFRCLVALSVLEARVKSGTLLFPLNPWVKLTVLAVLYYTTRLSNCIEIWPSSIHHNKSFASLFWSKRRTQKMVNFKGAYCTIKRFFIFLLLFMNF